MTSELAGLLLWVRQHWFLSRRGERGPRGGIALECAGGVQSTRLSCGGCAPPLDLTAGPACRVEPSRQRPGESQRWSSRCMCGDVAAPGTWGPLGPLGLFLG